MIHNSTDKYKYTNTHTDLQCSCKQSGSWGGLWLMLPHLECRAPNTQWEREELVARNGMWKLTLIYLLDWISCITEERDCSLWYLCTVTDTGGERNATRGRAERVCVSSLAFVVKCMCKHSKLLVCFSKLELKKYWKFLRKLIWLCKMSKPNLPIIISDAVYTRSIQCNLDSSEYFRF